MISIYTLDNYITCLGEMGMGSGYNTHVMASEQGGVVNEP